MYHQEPHCMPDHLVDLWNAAFDNPWSKREYSIMLASISGVDASYAESLITLVATAKYWELPR